MAPRSGQGCGPTMLMGQWTPRQTRDIPVSRAMAPLPTCTARASPGLWTRYGAYMRRLPKHHVDELARHVDNLAYLFALLLGLDLIASQREGLGLLLTDVRRDDEPVP